MKSIKKISTILLLLISSFYIIGCTSKDKLLTLSANVKEDMKIKENSILESMNAGSTALNNKDFAEAKNEFEKAISYDKSNIKTYADIKGKYLDAKRFDDAYYFIKMAIDNGIDVDNMKVILEGIKSNFEIAEINQSVPLNSKYTLPTEVSININDEPTEVRITWNTNAVITSKAGTYVYDGIAEEYGRNIKVNLTIKYIERKFGILKNVFESNGKLYASFNEADLFLNEEATKEAKKDNSPYLHNGELSDPIYIRNHDTTSIKIQIPESATFKLCHIGSNDINGKNVDFISFKDYILKKFANENASFLTWITFENDTIITSMEEQYTP